MARKRSPETEKRWRTLLSELERSDQTVASFATQHGVSTASIYQWRKRLGPNGSRRRRQPKPKPRGESPRRARSSSPFVRLDVAIADRVEVELPSGVRIHVPAAQIDALQAAIGAGHALVMEGSTC